MGDKMFAKSSSVQKTRKAFLGYFSGVFEMIGDNIIREHKQTTAMRFRDIERFEAYIISTDIDYDAMILILLVIFEIK